MYISAFFYIIYTFALIGLSIFALFLVRRITFLNALLKEKEQISKRKGGDNPLGKLFSPDTKSLSITIKKGGVISDINTNLLNLLGYSKKQLIGQNIYGTLMPVLSNREPLETNVITKIFKNPNLYTENETEFLTKSGEKIYISWTNRLIKDKKGIPVELRSVGFDITDRKNLEQELQFIASKDPQTGVLNRLALLENGTRELKRAIRYKHDFSVLAFRLLSADKDLTSLQVEDLLKQVVSICRKTIRDVDYLGRIGEAEFILLLPETEEKNVPFLQKRLEEKILEYNLKNKRYPIFVSFGKSSYTPKIKSIDELISKAIINIKKRKTK